MTKEEMMACNYGKTFDLSLVPSGHTIACCFDRRMQKLISNARTERGLHRNMKNMDAWYRGLETRNDIPKEELEKLKAIR